MHMENWDDIRYFLAVARGGSVTRAADTLDVNHTTVSRRIQAFEQRLGTRLFDRLPSGWAITVAGEDILATAEQVEEQADSLHRQLQAQDQAVSGLLRVTAEEMIMRPLLMSALKDFSEHHPQIQIHCFVSQDLLNLARREADIAFRATDQPPPYLIGTRIAHIAYAIYGTQALYERVIHTHDSASRQSIPAISLIGDGRSSPPWVQKNFPHAQINYRADSLAILFEAAKQGIGIAQLPCALGDPEPELRRIPATFVDPGWGLWLLSHVDLRTTARIRIFRDFMLAALRKKTDLIEGRQTTDGKKSRPTARSKKV